MSPNPVWILTRVQSKGKEKEKEKRIGNEQGMDNEMGIDDGKEPDF